MRITRKVYIDYKDGLRNTLNDIKRNIKKATDQLSNTETRPSDTRILKKQLLSLYKAWEILISGLDE
jgi:hypothetical protein